jgi:hypothetical protein
MQVAMMAPVDAAADGHLGTEVAFRDAVDATLAEEVLAHALALLVAGLNAVDLLGTRALGSECLLAGGPVGLLRRGLLLLLALPLLHGLLLLALLPLGTLGLLALLPFHTLLLLALAALDALLLLLLAALGPLRFRLRLRPLHSSTLRSPLRSRLRLWTAALCARRRSLRCGPLGNFTHGTTLVSVAILRLGETCARRSAEQQHACRSCDPLATHHNALLVGASAARLTLH